MNISIYHENGVQSVKYDSERRVFHFLYPCDNTSVCSAFMVSFPPGLYYLEVWGAQGGNATLFAGVGGCGGYSCGLFETKVTRNLYLHIGGSTPAQYPSNPSYNGGTMGLNTNDGPGGGATDFRFSSGSWDIGLESRIIVGGGGGGAYINMKGGNGGGLNGSSLQTGNNRPCYGTQNGCEGRIGEPLRDGEFGKGAGYSSGSGGSGYWGGGNALACSGGGGSGYIGGVTSSFFFKKVTFESNHTGNGEAKIHIIHTYERSPFSFICSHSSDLSLLFLFNLYATSGV